MIWSTGIFKFRLVLGGSREEDEEEEFVIAFADAVGNLELEAEFELDETVIYGVGVDSEIAWRFAGGAFHPVGLACNLAAVLLANSSPSMTSAVMDRSWENRQGRRRHRESGQGTPEKRPRFENMTLGPQ